MTEIVRDDKDRRLAVIAGPEDFPKDGDVTFLTDAQQPLQLGLLAYDSGDEAAAHTHPDSSRDVHRHQEVVHVVSGSLSVDVYDDKRDHRGTVSVDAGETVLFLRGGRGWTASEETKIIEVKQGPYDGDDDIIRF